MLFAGSVYPSQLQMKLPERRYNICFITATTHKVHQTLMYDIWSTDSYSNIVIVINVRLPRGTIKSPNIPCMASDDEGYNCTDIYIMELVNVTPYWGSNPYIYRVHQCKYRVNEIIIPILIIRASQNSLIWISGLFAHVLLHIEELSNYCLDTWLVMKKWNNKMECCFQSNTW